MSSMRTLAVLVRTLAVLVRTSAVPVRTLAVPVRTLAVLGQRSVLPPISVFTPHSTAS